MKQDDSFDPAKVRRLYFASNALVSTLDRIWTHAELEVGKALVRNALEGLAETIKHHEEGEPSSEPRPD